MENDLIKLTVPNKPDYVGVVRLTTSAIASRIGFNIEEIEDIKVAIAEACIDALDKSEDLYIEYKVCLDKLAIYVKNVTEDEKSSERSKEKELGILIIKSLMDEVIFNDQGIEMIKIIEDGNKWLSKASMKQMVTVT